MIVCAALLVDKKIIVPCYRHNTGYSMLTDLTDKKFSEYESIDEGFMTHKGEFLNREDAWKHAEECGQLSYNTLHYGSTPPVLFSEDLY